MTYAVSTPTWMPLATVSKWSWWEGTDVPGVKNIAGICPRMVLFFTHFCGPQIPFRFVPFLTLNSRIKCKVQRNG